MIDFSDRENLTNRFISIDDATAVIGLLLIEIYSDLAAPNKFENKLTGLANRLSEYAGKIKIDERRAFVSALSAYLMGTEPGVEIE